MCNKAFLFANSERSKDALGLTRVRSEPKMKRDKITILEDIGRIITESARPHRKLTGRSCRTYTKSSIAVS